MIKRMELNELQEKAEEIINKIDNKLNFKHNNENLILHLTEELGETSRQILNPKLKRGELDLENLKEEIADLILLISKLANNNDIDIEEAINNKIKKLKERHNLN